MQMTGDQRVSYIQVLVGATPWRFESSRAYCFFRRSRSRERPGIFCAWTRGASCGRAGWVLPKGRKGGSSRGFATIPHGELGRNWEGYGRRPDPRLPCAYDASPERPQASSGSRVPESRFREGFRDEGRRPDAFRGNASRDRTAGAVLRFPFPLIRFANAGRRVSKWRR